MNLEIYQDKKHFRNFWSIFIKLAQKMRYRLLNTSCKFHQNPFINKDFFSIRQSIELILQKLRPSAIVKPFSAFINKIILIFGKQIFFLVINWCVLKEFLNQSLFSRYSGLFIFWRPSWIYICNNMMRTQFFGKKLFKVKYRVLGCCKPKIADRRFTSRSKQILRGLKRGISRQRKLIE